MSDKEKWLYRLIMCSIAGFLVLGIVWEGPGAAWQGFCRILRHPARLITDYTVVGGIGATLVNAGLNGLIALVLVKMVSVRLSGPTVAAVFTIIGFSFFGKTPVNILPIILGVCLAGRLVKKPFQNYILIALFGTALGPLVTYLAYEAGLTGFAAPAAAAAAGVAAGMVLPALAISMLRLHEGYNLYNIGFTCGFLGLFAASLLLASNKSVAITVIWGNEPSLLLMLLVPVMSLLFIAAGVIMSGGPASAFKGFKAIQKLPGRLPSDFMEMVSAGASLVNAGVMGLAGSLYIWAAGGAFNGPTLGALFTLIGFATFGKNLRNSWPVVLGVLIATLLFGEPLTAPGPLLALLFGTTLAPLAGEFGPGIGIMAGFLHLVLVMQTAAWHGGLDLYNNGFTGGLVATFMYAGISWYRSNINEKEKMNR